MKFHGGTIFNSLQHAEYEFSFINWETITNVEPLTSLQKTQRYQPNSPWSFYTLFLVFLRASHNKNNLQGNKKLAKISVHTICFWCCMWIFCLSQNPIFNLAAILLLPSLTLGWNKKSELIFCCFSFFLRCTIEVRLVIASFRLVEFNLGTNVSWSSKLSFGFVGLSKTNLYSSINILKTIVT